MNNPYRFPLLLIFILSLCLCRYVSADTVIRKDGTELKGVLVEEYADRIVFSTIDGEVPILKRDIKDLVIDDEEINLLRIAEKARNANDYNKSAEYYERVLVINPDSEPARKGMIALREIAFQRTEAMKGAVLRKQEELDRYRTIPIVGKRGEEVEVMDQKLYRVMGFKVDSLERCYTVTTVKMESPAFWAGIRRGDTVVSVRGRLVCYDSLKDVLNLLLRGGSMRVNCAIERTVRVGLGSGGLALNTSGLIGATLYLGSDGIMVKDVKAGGEAKRAEVENGDMVISIDGKQTRYMPLAKVVDLMRSSKNDYVTLTIRRNAVIWKEAR